MNQTDKPQPLIPWNTPGSKRLEPGEYAKGLHKVAMAAGKSSVSHQPTTKAMLEVIQAEQNEQLQAHLANLKAEMEQRAEEQKAHKGKRQKPLKRRGSTAPLPVHLDSEHQLEQATVDKVMGKPDGDG